MIGHFEMAIIGRMGDPIDTKRLAHQVGIPTNLADSWTQVERSARRTVYLEDEMLAMVWDNDAWYTQMDETMKDFIAACDAYSESARTYLHGADVKGRSGKMVHIPGYHETREMDATWRSLPMLEREARLAQAKGPSARCYQGWGRSLVGTGATNETEPSKRSKRSKVDSPVHSCDLSDPTRGDGESWSDFYGRTSRRGCASCQAGDDWTLEQVPVTQVPEMRAMIRADRVSAKDGGRKGRGRPAMEGADTGSIGGSFPTAPSSAHRLHDADSINTARAEGTGFPWSRDQRNLQRND